MNTARYYFLFVVCCLVGACKKDRPDATVTKLPGATGNIYVVCEGAYKAVNASLYAYSPSKDSVYGDLYKSVNKQALGDVFQSMQHIGDKLFLCINNSDKVVVLNAVDWTLAGTINIKKPRYILPISATKAYVSAEYDDKVYIIDPQAMAVTGSITLPYLNTEGMAAYYGDAFVCALDTSSNKLYKIDEGTDQVVQAIPAAGFATQEVLLDKEQMLWVLSGDQPDGRPGALTRIDPSTGKTLTSYLFPADADPIKPVFNPSKDTLYFMEAYNTGALKNGIYRMDIHSASLPQQAFVEEGQYQYFWALGIDPVNGDIYIGDAKDFNQKGTVYVYRPDGTAKSNFNVGPGPGHFYFDY